jgi:multiple sugar transport system permease protein
VVRNRRARWALGSPLLIYLAVLVAFPLGYTIWTSFQNLSVQQSITHFVGTLNYRLVLTDPEFWGAIWFTVRFMVAVTVSELVLGTLLALLFDRVFPGKRTLFSLMLVPIMTAPALMGVAFELLLNGDIGVVPYFLGRLGIGVSLFAPGSVEPMLMGLDVLQWTPFVFLVVYSGLQTVPTELYEAAEVDGAGYGRSVWSVVFPLLKPIILICIFIRAINAFRTFDVIYILTGGGPGTLTTTASIYVYNKAFTSGMFGEGAAASLVIALLLMPLLPLLVPRIVDAQLKPLR